MFRLVMLLSILFPVQTIAEELIKSAADNFSVIYCGNDDFLECADINNRAECLVAVDYSVNQCANELSRFYEEIEKTQDEPSIEERQKNAIYSKCFYGAIVGKINLPEERLSSCLVSAFEQHRDEILDSRGMME